MQFNQTNNNKGDVNNAISGKGNVVQTTGSAITGAVTAAAAEKGNVIQTSGASSTGDVTAAASEKGNVAQTSGESNRVQVDHPKESFWSELWKKLGSAWKWIKALFTGAA